MTVIARFWPLHVRRALALPPLVAALVAAFPLLAHAESRPAEKQATGTVKQPAPLVLDEAPEPLVPKHPRNEEQEERLEALALFSAARLHEQKQDYAKALRLYQRALRHDPSSATIAESIVPLAARLGRHPEAVRYAIKLAELQVRDPLLMKRLAIYLTEIGDWPGALKLYEQVVAADKNEKPAAEDVVVWMEMGRLYHLTERHDKAAEKFGRVLEVLDHPDRFGLDSGIQKPILGDKGMGLLLMGDAFIAAGQSDRAKIVYERANQIADDKALLAFNLARVADKAGKPQESLDQLQKYFAERGSKQGLAPFRLFAETLEKLGKKQDLLGRVEKLHAGDPKNVPLAYFLAEQYLEADRLDKAEPLYRDLIEKEPTLTGYHNLIEIYRKQKNYEALTRLLGRAIGAAGSLKPLVDEDKPFSEDGALVDGVLAAAKALAKEEKEPHYETMLAVALVAIEGKRYDDAAEFFALAEKAKPDQAARLRLSWALELVLQEQHERAVEVLKRGIERKLLVDEPTFPFYLSGALEMCGQTDEALAAARKAVELAEAQDKKAAGRPAAKSKGKKPGEIAESSELPRCLSRIAWIFAHAKRHEEAEAAYRQLIEKYDAEKSPAIRQTLREARLMLSNLAVHRSDDSQAQEWVEQVLDEFPDDATALNDLGYLWAERGQHLAKAQRMIEKALEQEPDNAAFRDSLGWVFYQQGRHRQAVVELEKAAAKEPDPAVLEHLGDAYHAVGERTKSHETWRRAAEAFEKAGEKSKAERAKARIEKPPPIPKPAP